MAKLPEMREHLLRLRLSLMPERTMPIFALSRATSPGPGRVCHGCLLARNLSDPLRARVLQSRRRSLSFPTFPPLLKLI